MSSKIRFSCCSFNARSLKKEKLDYVRYLFEFSENDVIAVTETWFKNGVPDIYFDLQDYTIFRNDRMGRVGGGVAVYVKKTCQPK